MRQKGRCCQVWVISDWRQLRFLSTTLNYNMSLLCKAACRIGTHSTGPNHNINLQQQMALLHHQPTLTLDCQYVDTCWQSPILSGDTQVKLDASSSYQVLV